METLKALTEKGNETEYFYHVWCTKEAIFKTLDSSVQLETTFQSIHLSDFFEDGEWSLFQKEIDNYHLSLIYSDSGRERNAQFIPVELTTDIW